MIKKALLIIGFCMVGTLSGMQREKSTPDEALKKLKVLYKTFTKQERVLWLLQCAREGNVKDVQLLLELATPVNSTDQEKCTPLYWAALQGHVEVVKFLLSREDVEVNAANNARETPLLLAADHGHAEVVKVLLGTADVKVNVANSQGARPLHVAAEKGRIEVVKLLLGQT